MKHARATITIAIVTTAATLLTACGLFQTAEIERQSSNDYMVTGPILDGKAYIYGGHTVIEFDAPMSLVAVTDESGKPIEFEAAGRFYRLNRRVDKFSFSSNGRTDVFTAKTFARVFSSETATLHQVQDAAAPAPSPAVVLEPVRESKVEPIAEVPKVDQETADRDIKALLALTAKQVKEVQKALAHYSKNPKAKGEDLVAINARLDALERRIGLIRVSFDTESTNFSPSQAVAKILVNAAKLAERINILGRTDATKAGPADAAIAAGRAGAARDFLVAHGIDAEKISVSSKPDGDFITPNITAAERAINRRVEFQFLDLDHKTVSALQARR